MNCFLPGRAAAAALLASLIAAPLGAQRGEPAPVAAGRVPAYAAYAPGFDVLHYRIAIALPESGTHIAATATLSVAVVAPRRDTLRLDLSGLRATAVQAATRGAALRPAAFRQGDGRLFVAVPAEARTGDTLRIEIAYEGEPDDGLIIRQNVRGSRAIFADNWPDRARFWFPSIDHPGDKATVEFEVRAPRGWEVVANGNRVGAARETEIPADGVWRSRVPVPIPTYAMVIGATDFAIGTVTPCARGGRAPSRETDCVPVTYWAYPADSARAASTFRRAGQMIEYYASRFGPFPYQKLAHVQSSTRYGGMENVGAIFYSEQAIAEGRLGETTVAHETAHQWFGDAITESHWNHLWLSEGFATYFGMQFFESADGVTRFRELVQGAASGYMNSDVTDLAIVDTTAVPRNDLFALLNANSYQKGGLVLHMLRGLLGDSAFFAGIRRYADRHLHGNAGTADLRRALEESSGRDLGGFFEQWVYRPGFPTYRVSHTWDAAARQAVLTVEQRQKAAWPVFSMPIEFEFTTPQGTVRRKLDISGRRAVVRVDLPAPPSGVRLDPDGWLLKRVEGS